MLIPDRPPDETDRLEALRRLGILDTPPERPFDDLVEAARLAFDLPIALVSFIDGDRQWFKARAGLDAEATPRDVSFCGHAILNGGIFEVPDAPADDRFADNPLVTGPPHIRFYAGAVLMDDEGFRLGTLCIIDTVPRRLDDRQRRLLSTLARQVEAQLRLRRLNRQLDGMMKDGLKRLRADVEHLLRLTQYLPAPLVHIGKDLRWKFVSKAGEKWFRRPITDLIGRRLADTFSPVEWAETEPHLRRGLAGETGSYVVERVFADGRTRVVEVNYFPEIDDTGNVNGLFTFAADVTEKLAIERQLARAQRLEAVGQLTGGVAHDFNNLLAIIVGNLDFLREDLPAGSPQTAMVDNALDAAHRGAALTQRLLAVARRQVLKPGVVNVNDLVRSAVALIDRTLGEDIAVETALADGLPPVRIDPGQLENALLNLVLNARDAMASGGGALSILTSFSRLGADNGEGARPGDYVCILVRDTGAGMTPEVLARAFDPFFTTKDVGKGTGLGLSMVQGFVEQSGGVVRIDSNPGRGTDIRLLLPCALPAGGVRPLPAAPPAPAAARRKILVVEDSPAVRQLAVRAVERLGYAALDAEDGRRALALLEGDGDIAVLFTDIVLPGGMSGFELASEARRRRPDLGILMTSGNIDRAGTAPGAGGDILPKPYRLADLAARLAALTPADPPPASGDRRP